MTWDDHGQLLVSMKKDLQDKRCIEVRGREEGAEQNLYEGHKVQDKKSASSHEQEDCINAKS